MRVLLYGPRGNVGKVILAELVTRGHTVTAAYRTAPAPDDIPPGVTSNIADVTDATAVTSAAGSHDAVISAIGPGERDDPKVIEDAAHVLIETLPKAGIKRLLVVGGAGTLELRPGVMRMDDPSYPEQYRPQGIRQKAALEALRKSSLDWTYISPPIIFSPGARTGQYRVGGDAVLTDANGKSAISFEDYALALVDELETPGNLRRRITFAY